MTDQTKQIAKESKIGTKDSALSKFNLSFEYDRSWHEAKQTVQHRPTKNT